MTSSTTIPGLKTIDPIQGLVDYVDDIKPYHTKIFEVLTTYVYQDTLNVTITDTLNLDINSLQYDSQGRLIPTYSDDLNITLTETSFTETLDFFLVAPTPPTATIVASDIPNNIIYFAGDITNEVGPGDVMNITGSSGNNNNYDVLTVEHTGTQTAVIAVLIGTNFQPIASSPIGDTATFYQTDTAYTFQIPIQSVDITPITKIDQANCAAILATNIATLLPPGPPNYVVGEYDNIPLLGSTTGFGATATFVVTENNSDPSTATITNVIITNSGINYAVGDVLTPTLGMIFGFDSLVPGAASNANIAGTYYNVPLVGGTGTGASCSVIVSGIGNEAQVTEVLLSSRGSGYSVGEILSFSGIGFVTTSTIKVTVVFAPAPGTVNITIPGGEVFGIDITNLGGGYIVGDILSINNSYLGGTGFGFQAIITKVIGNNVLVSILSHGAGYGNGTYTNVPLIGGSGSGAVASVVVGGVSNLVSFTTQTIIVTGNVTRAIQAGSVFKIDTPPLILSVNNGIYYAIYVQYDPLVNTSTIGIGLPPGGQPTTPLFKTLTTNAVATGQVVIPYNITGYDDRYDAPYDGMAGYRIISG